MPDTTSSLSEYQAAYLDLLEPEFVSDETTPQDVVGVIDGSVELRCRVEFIGTKSVSDNVAIFLLFFIS